MYTLARDITKDGHEIPKGVRLTGLYEVAGGNFVSQVYWDGEWVKLLLAPADVSFALPTEAKSKNTPKPAPLPHETIDALRTFNKAFREHFPKSTR